MKLEYLIVEASNARTLENQIAVFLSNGWELQGGVCAYRDRNNYTIFTQALTK